MDTDKKGVHLIDFTFLIGVSGTENEKTPDVFKRTVEEVRKAVNYFSDEDIENYLNYVEFEED